MKKLIPLVLILALLASCNANTIDIPTTTSTNSTSSTASTESNNTFYTVSFNTDGGTEVSQQSVFEGMTAVEPKSPTKLGYVFLRWTLNNKPYDFTTPVTSDLELKATYTSAQATNLAKNDAKKIYAIADILVNRTNLTNPNLTSESYITASEASDLVIYANNLTTGKSKLYIDEPKDNTTIYNTINKQIEYNSSDYNTKISNISLKGNASEETEDESTTTIKLESLSLEVTYTKATTTSSGSSYITKYEDVNSVKEAVTFKNVNIVWAEKTIDGIACVEGTIETTVELGSNKGGSIKMSFTKMYGELYSANYLGMDLSF